MTTKCTPYKRHRYPSAIISHTVWLYHRFSLRFREVEELLAARGVVVSYEAIRQWCLKFPSTYTKKLPKSAGQPGDIWHLDEVFINVRGQQHYLWRAVDQDGVNSTSWSSADTTSMRPYASFASYFEKPGYVHTRS